MAEYSVNLLINDHKSPAVQSALNGTTVDDANDLVYLAALILMF